MKKQSNNNFFACNLCFLREKYSFHFHHDLQFNVQVLTTSERKMLSKSSAHNYSKCMFQLSAKNTHELHDFEQSYDEFHQVGTRINGVSSSTFLFEYGATNMFQTHTSLF